MAKGRESKGFALTEAEAKMAEALIALLEERETGNVLRTILVKDEVALPKTVAKVLKWVAYNCPVWVNLVVGSAPQDTSRAAAREAMAGLGEAPSLDQLIRLRERLEALTKEGGK